MSWWRRHPLIVVSSVLVVLAAGSGFAYAMRPVPVPPTYVTDGSFVFDANVRHVETLIHQENQWADRQHRPVVTIAVVAPMDPAPALGWDADATRHALEGAYLAQYQANHLQPGGALVRLVVAGDTPLPQTESALLSEKPAAVAGFGAGAADLAQELAAAHVMVVDAANDGISGAVSVAPAISDETIAGIRFLNGNPDPHNPLPATPRIWLMRDVNDANGYADALALRLTQVLAQDGSRPYHIVGPGSEYDSAVPAAGTVLTASVTAGAAAVCRTGVNVVYFAGSAPELANALTVLAHRPCAASRPLTVLTGSDAIRLAGQHLWPAAGNLDVYVTALASPGMWGATPATGFATYARDFPTEPGTALDDGWAILFHDSVLTAVTAARSQSAPAAVTVQGASGSLKFDSTGDPVGKAIPVVQLGPDGSLTYRGLSAG